jgi:hypothetical protein
LCFHFVGFLYVRRGLGRRRVSLLLLLRPQVAFCDRNRGEGSSGDTNVKHEDKFFIKLDPPKSVRSTAQKLHASVVAGILGGVPLRPR